MTRDEIRAAIEGRFASEWAGRTPIQFAGHDFDTATHGGSEYVMLSHTLLTETQRTIGAPGANLRRTPGLVTAILYTRRSDHPGTTRLNAHTEIARPIFLNWRSDAISFAPTSPGAIRFSESPDGFVTPWAMRTLRWGFTVDVFDA